MCAEWVLSSFSRVSLFATLGTGSCQVPLSVGFSRQEYWSRLPCPPPGDLPNPGVKLHLFHLQHWQAGSLPLSHLGSPNRMFFLLCLVAQSCPTFWDPMGCSLPGSSLHGDFPGKNIGLSCHALLRRIFLTQGLNPGLPYCRRILYSLGYSNLKRNKILTHATTWINLVNIMLSETNQTPKDKYCMLPLI